MDESELRDSFKPVKPAERPAEEQPGPLDAGDDLAALMRIEIRAIQGAFAAVTKFADRDRLQKRYAKLDAWLSEFKELDAGEDTEQSSKRRRKLRAEVLDEFRKWRGEGAQQRVALKQIDAGRKRIREKAKAGAGPAAHRRIKDQIEHLLNNYASANDNKIEALIDQWRRSGDPSYDPAIRLKLRKVRKQKEASKHAF